MKPRDFIVIPVAAIAVMALNVAISFAIVWLYSSLLDPGHAASYYESFAMRAAPVSSVLAGIPLMLLAGFLLAKVRGREGLLVAAATAMVYILVDTAALLSMDAGQDVWIWAALSHATKLLAALAGARLGASRPAPEHPG